MPTLFARGSDGVVCIYTGSDNVVADPTLDLSRVLFHSSLLYPSLTQTITTTITLPDRALNSQTLTTHTIQAHGLGGIPFVLGYIDNLVPNVALAGSVPVEIYASYGGFGRFVTLGADATNIVLHENSVIPNAMGGATGSGTFALDLVVYVTDLLLT